MIKSDKIFIVHPQDPKLDKIAEYKLVGFGNKKIQLKKKTWYGWKTVSWMYGNLEVLREEVFVYLLDKSKKK